MSTTIETVAEAARQVADKHHGFPSTRDAFRQFADLIDPPKQVVMRDPVTLLREAAMIFENLPGNMVLGRPTKDLVGEFNSCADAIGPKP